MTFITPPEPMEFVHLFFFAYLCRLVCHGGTFIFCSISKRYLRFYPTKLVRSEKYAEMILSINANGVKENISKKGI